MHLVVLWLGHETHEHKGELAQLQKTATFHHFTLASLGRHSAVVGFWSLAMGMECWDAPTVCWDAPTVCTLWRLDCPRYAAAFAATR